MGLLDILQSDDGRLAMGLLAAAGPSAMPASFGQRAMGAIQGFDAWKQDQEDRKLKQQLLAAQVQEHQLKARKMDGLLGALQQWTSPQADLSSANADTVKATGSLSPTLANAQVQGQALQQRQQQKPLYGIPPQAIQADLAFNDGKGVADMIFKRGAPNMQLHNGVALDMNSVRPGTTLPTISQNGQASQLIPDPAAPGGYRVIAPAGALEAYSAFRNADEAAKASTDLVKVYNPATQREEFVPRSAALAGQRQIPKPPAIGEGGRDTRIPANVQAGRDTERLRILNDELTTATDPTDRAALQREIARVRPTTGQAPMPGGGVAAGPSVPEKLGQGLNESMMKKMSDAIEASSQRAEGAQGTLRAVSQIEGAIASGKVMAGPGTAARVWMNQVGNVAFGGGPDALVATRNTIQGLAKMSLEGRSQLKGSGSITDFEQRALERAQSGDIESMTVPEINAVIKNAKRTSQLMVQQHTELMRRADANDWKSFFSQVDTPMANSANPTNQPASDLRSLVRQEIEARRKASRGASGSW